MKLLTKNSVLLAVIEHIYFAQTLNLGMFYILILVNVIEQLPGL